jgi:hypothetical protein
MEDPLKSNWISSLVLLLVIGLTIGFLIGVRPPTWIVALLGAMALALLYIVARLGSRYDPLDPRFGSCIPPITMPRAGNDTSRESRPQA